MAVAPVREIWMFDTVIVPGPSYPAMVDWLVELNVEPGVTMLYVAPTPALVEPAKVMAVAVFEPIGKVCPFNVPLVKDTKAPFKLFTVHACPESVMVGGLLVLPAAAAVVVPLAVPVAGENADMVPVMASVTPEPM
jgi:hypothetical protein